MKKITAILSLMLISSTVFANVTVSCSGVDEGQNINSKISNITFLGTQQHDIEEKALVSLGDGRSVSLILQADKDISKSKLSILIKGKDSKGLLLNRLIKGSLSQGVSYFELPANNMMTMISCNQISE